MRTLRIALLALLLAFPACAWGQIGTWTLVTDDTFLRGSYPTAANAAGGTNVGAPNVMGSGNWYDNFGGIWSVTSAGTLTAATDATNNAWKLNTLSRPDAETTQNQRVVATYKPGQTANSIGDVGLRWQSGTAGTTHAYYLARYTFNTSGAGAATIWRVNSAGGAAQQTGSAPTAITYDNTKSLSLDFSAVTTGSVGSRTTALTLTVSDGTSTATITASNGEADSGAALQSGGNPCVAGTQLASATFSEVKTYSDSGQIVASGPAYSTSSVNTAGTAVTVNFTIPGTSPLLPASGVTGFVVNVAGSPVTVSSATASGTAVTLNLASTVYTGQAVTVSYAPGNLTDSATTPAAASAFGPVTATNNSTQVQNATGYTQTGSPAPGTVSQGQVITLAYALTGGNALSSSLVITPANGGTASGNFSASTVTINNGSTTGTVTFTSTSTGTLSLAATHTGGGFAGNPANLSYTVVSGPTAVNMDNAFFVRSPYNFPLVGTGSSAYIASANTLAYVRFLASVPSGGNGNIVLNLDTSCWNAVSSSSNAQYGKVSVSVDGGGWIDYQLPVASTTAQLTIATGLSAGSHAVNVVYKVRRADNTGGYDVWGANANGSGVPVCSLKITGVLIDTLVAGGTLADPSTNTLTARLPKNILVWGDSITRGRLAGLNGTTNANVVLTDDDAKQTWAVSLGQALNAEVGAIGYDVQGWATSGSGAPPGVPPFPSAWNLHWAGFAHTFTIVPDYVFVCQGENDYLNSASVPDANVISGINTFLTSFRATSGLGTVPLFLCVPMSGGKRSVLAGITLGANTYLLDAGTGFQNGLTFSPGVPNTNNAKSNDGVHPYGSTSLQYGAIMARQAQQALGGTTVSKGRRRLN